MSSGNLRLVVHRDTWAFEFLDSEGRRLTGSTFRGTGIIIKDGARYLTEKLSLSVDEHIYGLGERFSDFDRKGQSIRMWNVDAQCVSDSTYKNIPFYVSSRGYGVLVDSFLPVEFEIATEDHSAVRMAVPGDALDMIVLGDGDIARVLSVYSKIVGYPPRVPVWSYGLWLTTSFTTSYDEATVKEHVEGMLDRGIPISVFHFDCFWMKRRHWCDFEWDSAAFPDPEGLIAWLHDKGIKVCVWINPYVSELSSIFQEGVEGNFFLKNKGGRVYQLDWWQPGMAFVDFTNESACTWYQSKLKKLLAMGVDTFKTDFGESVPLDAIAADGSDGHSLHNRYALLYNKTVYDTIASVRGIEETLVFARSATIGSRCFPVHWGGDSIASYEHMAAQLRAGLSFGLGGGAYWSHDIGGFFGTATPDLYKRWVAFGLLSSHARLHGNSSYRVPWLFDEESVAVLRHFLRLRMRLLPYLVTLGEKANSEGLPIMRPMVLEFPDDKICRSLQDQYMFGNALLIAPVLNPDGAVETWLPRGLWKNWWDDDIVSGESYVKQKVDYFKIPMFLRADTLVPLSNKKDIQDNAPAIAQVDTSLVDLLVLPSGENFADHISTKDEVASVEFDYNANETLSIRIKIQENEVDSLDRVVSNKEENKKTLRIISKEPPKNVEGADSWHFENNEIVLMFSEPSAEIHLRY